MMNIYSTRSLGLAQVMLAYYRVRLGNRWILNIEPYYEDLGHRDRFGAPGRFIRGRRLGWMVLAERRSVI